ncbi:MAG: transcription initiation factor IIB [DPANN group archaeon]|nr:transcription initiation factor IIB [DPANN group archaeon]
MEIENTKCPECGFNNFERDESKGELICMKCGAIVNIDMVDTSPEWRAFDVEQKSKRTRTGAPMTFTKHDKGFSTEIGSSTAELYKVPVKKRAQYYRLRKWHKRLTKSKDRNLSYSFSELVRQISYLNLSSSVHEEVARLYEKAVTKGLVRGRSMESIITALIYAIAREHGSPRTLSELSAASGIEKREIGRAYRYIARELKIRILPATAKEYIPRFSSLLGLSGEVQARSKEILDKAADEDIISGKGPTGIAASALYIAAVLGGEKRTQRDIADVVGVTEVTIRNRYKDLVEKLGIEEEVEKKAAETEKRQNKRVEDKIL